MSKGREGSDRRPNSQFLINAALVLTGPRKGSGRNCVSWCLVWCRKKRDVSDYERADTVSETEVQERRSIAEKLRADLEAWLGKNHPLLKP
jgi:hypothetical protein